VGGARRWLDLGLARFQPSEFAKVALVILFAVVCSRRAARGETDTKSLIVPFMFAQIPIALIYFEPDLGTAFVIEMVLLTMLVVAGLKVRVVAMVTLAIAPIVYHLIMGTNYRLRRVMGFIDPWAHRSDEGYQLTEALISIGSGGLTGLGLGQGKKQLFFLPEAHTDFIFAILAEELGFIGVVFFVTAFSILVFRSVRIAMQAPDLFRVFLATGITAMLAIPMLFNLAVVTGLVPTKGLPLPFMSSGGSNMLMALVCVGVLLRIHLETQDGRDISGESA
jgi:cell division protein FtsW